MADSPFPQERVPALVEKILDARDRVASLPPSTIVRIFDYLEALRMEFMTKLLDANQGTGEVEYDPIEYTKTLGRVETITRIREDFDRILQQQAHEQASEEDVDE